MEKGIAINIVKLKESKFEIDESFDTSKKKEILIGFQCTITENIPDNLLNINLSVIYKDKETEDQIMKVGVESSYFINNLSDIITRDGEKLTFKAPILPTLLSSTLGALRGIMSIKTAGTNLEKYILPLIPVDHILNNQSESKS